MYYFPAPRRQIVRGFVCALFIGLSSCTVQTEDPPPSEPFEGELAVSKAQALSVITLPQGHIGKDATIDSLAPNRTGGVDESVGGAAWVDWMGRDRTLRGLVEFDLTALAGADIRRATLTLTADTSASAQNQLSTQSGPNEAVLRRVTSAWNEGTVTWNTQPSTTMADEVRFGPSDGTQSSFTVDVTKLVTIMARPGMNHGFMIQLATEQKYRAMRFSSSDVAAIPRHPKLVVEYTPRCGDTPTQFTETAYVGTSACSDKDYGTIDDCYNTCNPPTPTLLRPTSQYLRNVTDNVISIDPDYNQVDAKAGAAAVLPFQRSTNDGRLFISGGCRGCEDQLNLQVFRPENLTHDFKQRRSNPPTPKGFRGVVHGFLFHNPMTSLLPDINVTRGFPDVVHSTICDASGAAVSDSAEDAAAQILSHAGRNPVACQAHYETSGDATPKDDLKGDCYDITLLTAGMGLVPRGEGNLLARWELLSTDLTVFVPNAKQATTASNGGQDTIWIYPRNPEGEEKTASSWRLPAYRPFNPHLTDYRRLAPPVDLKALLTSDPEFKCYTSSNPPVRDPNGHKWCQFFDRQHQANFFNVDSNRNSTRGDGADWDGTTCGHEFSGPNCGGKTLFELVTTGDGKLLVANVDGVQYSYNTKGACRADGWTQFQPISFMPADSDIYEHYDIGRTQRRDGVSYPFRDSMGHEIPFGELNTGAYPWIDRAGKNLFFSVNRIRDGYYARQARLAPGRTTKDGKKDEAPAQFPPISNDDRVMMNPDRSPGGQQLVVGAWTQGKAVTLDGGQNISDLSGQDGRTYDMRLFSGPDYTFNPRTTTSASSFENQFNYLDWMRPTQPFDVVWTMQSNVQRNPEVVFDEYLRNDAFVVAHMNAPSDMSTPTDIGSTFPKDGFVPTYPNADVRFGGIADFRFKENPLLQNAATSNRCYSSSAVTPPTTLRVRGGARIEPLGLGGVLGKGLYFDGLNDVVDMGYQSEPTRTNWYLGVWLESHDESTQGIPRTVFYFADTSWVGIEQSDASGTRQFTLVAYDGLLKTTQRLSIGSIVQTKKYFHFGLKLRNVGIARRLDFYIDGSPVGGLSFSDPLLLKSGFNVMHGPAGDWTWMTLGDPGPAAMPGQVRASFRGWLDELRIYALSDADVTNAWTEEFICNTALGTLVDLTVRSGETSHARLTALRTRASAYPGAPSVLCEQMKLESYSSPNDFPNQYDQGLCIDRVHKNPRSSASLAERCLRAQRFDVATRNLVADQVRPSFSDLRFCQSCHHGEARISGLLPDALLAGSLERWRDPRRQPLDRPATLSGVFPSWLNTGLDLQDRTRTLDHLLDPGRAVP
jgi:hypothetical protein